MKRNILYILCGIFLLVGCQQKEVISGVGYISVSGIEVQSQTVAEVASRSTDDIIWTVELWKGNEILRALSTEP